VRAVPHGTTLVVTDAGLLAIGIEPVVDTQPTAADTSKPVHIRAGTKQAQIIALLQRPEGAAIIEIVAENGWMPHSVRGMISGTLKKKFGLLIASEKVEGIPERQFQDRSCGLHRTDQGRQRDRVQCAIKMQTAAKGGSFVK